MMCGAGPSGVAPSLREALRAAESFVETVQTWLGAPEDKHEALDTIRAALSVATVSEEHEFVWIGVDEKGDRHGVTGGAAEAARHKPERLCGCNPDPYDDEQEGWWWAHHPFGDWKAAPPASEAEEKEGKDGRSSLGSSQKGEVIRGE